MIIPIQTTKRVWHIGTMNPKNIGTNSGTGSLEGNSLSVSPCPEAWRRIAKLGGNALFKLEPTRGRAQFLDIHALLKQQTSKSYFKNYGFENDLCKKDVFWSVSTTDENGDSFILSFKDKDQAFFEADDDPARVRKSIGFSGTDKLFKITGIDAKNWKNPYDALAISWALEKSKYPSALDLDGFWFWDKFDPENYSAPRAGIFKHKVESWSHKKLDWRFAPDDEEEIDSLPQSEKVSATGSIEAATPARSIRP